MAIADNRVHSIGFREKSAYEEMGKFRRNKDCKKEKLSSMIQQLKKVDLAK
jgi:hypothetical protein